MTNKFTEEQYQKIVEISNKYRHDTQYSVGLLIEFVFKTNPLAGELTKLFNQALAISNPLTREWAHDKFVEKEKRYVWRLKDNEKFVLASDGVIINIGFNNKSKLTESEIKEWGYNPEMFDREAV